MAVRAWGGPAEPRIYAFARDLYAFRDIRSAFGALFPATVAPMPLDPETARELIEAVFAGFGVLGGLMAYYTGLAANRGERIGASPEITTRWIHAGMARGFREALFWGFLAAMIVVWA